MSILYPWMFFFLIPLFLLYKGEEVEEDKYKRRQKSLLYLSIFFIITALSRPVIPNTLNEQKFDAQDFIIAIDASYSMQATDLKPNRYEVAKENIKEILRKLNKNRFSIFAFTTNAMLISPPTTDTAISMMALNSLEVKYILTKGTSLLNLITTISKTSYEKKRVIIFSDGGENNDMNELVELCKTNNIIPYVVATASKNGSLLQQNGKNLKDEKNNLVISRINPFLKEFALQSGGKYYLLQNSSTALAKEIIADITSTTKQNEQTKIKVLSYKELFYLPVLFAMILFFAAVTKVHQLYLLIPIVFLPNTAHTFMIDFYHLEKAQNYFDKANYTKSAKEFSKLTPSLYSYYNQGVAYYKAKKYRDAMEYFSQIKSNNKDIKQKLFYNMGNCAVKLKKYDRAKIYYQKALNLGYDKDSFYNLSLLYTLELKEKKDVSNMLRKQNSKKQTHSSKRNKTQNTKKNPNSASNSNQKANQSSAGAGSDKKKKTTQTLQKTKQPKKLKYKLGYEAYELINKGYTDEKHPW